MILLALHLSLSSPSVVATDEVELHLSIPHAPEYTIQIDPLIRSIEEGAEEIYRVVDYRLDGDELNVTLDPWLPGDHLIGFYQVELTADDRPTLLLSTDAVSLHIDLPPSSDLEALPLLALDEQGGSTLSRVNRRAFTESKEVLEADWLLKEKRLRQRKIAWGWLLLSLASAGGVYGLSHLRFHRSVLLPNPRLIALEALDRLEQEGLTGEPFMTRLSSIVRTYIEGAFDVRAPERTTEEFLGEISVHSHFTGELQSLLKVFLQFADLAKFAQVAPSSDECRSALNSAREVIQWELPASDAMNSATESSSS